jgi:glycine oxidase
LVLDRDVCAGVVLDEGPLLAGATVLAAGSWSSLVPGVPTSLPAIRPARGQIVQLDEQPPRLRMIVLGGGAYAVPRGDGRVVCGSTLEFVGYQKQVTARGVQGILARVTGAVPCLGEAAITSTWSGLRPHSASEEPLVGRAPIPGLFLATGHFRNGILLAKVTADDVADAILGDAASRSRQQLH